LTLIENAGSETLVMPSLTPMMMFAYVPAEVLAGVPDRVPVLVLKLAQAGMFVTLNVNLSPSESLAVGVKV
jgi:hypothetical protein